MGWVIGNGIGIPFRMGGGTNWSSYWQNRHPELKTYVDGLITSLSKVQIIALGEFIEAIKTGMSITALSDVFDAMYILAGETSESSLKNIVKDANHATLEGTPSPAFTASRGFLPDGSHGYINLNYNPTTHGVKFTQNNAGMGLFSKTDREQDAGKVSMGVLSGGIYTYMFGRYTVSFGGLVNGGAVIGSIGTTDTLGMLSMFRTSATNVLAAKDKTLGSDTASNSTGINNGNIYLGARNNAGTADAFDNLLLSFAYIGRDLSETELGVLVDAFNTYLDTTYTKRITILGDSLSDSLSYTLIDWVDYITEPYYGIKNHAVTGQTIIGHLSSQVLASATDDADIIIIALGTNDNNAGSMPDIQTAINNGIDALRISNPDATIYYMNVLPRWTDSGGGTIVDKSNIRTAVAAACAGKGVTCWDTFTTPWILSTDTSDGLHTTTGGAVKIWNEISSRI